MHTSPSHVPSVSRSVSRVSSPEEKIALFRSLFRGRADVFPVRFESRATGKSGYSPACANEWVRGVCEKPRVKCNACTARRFLPVTDEAIRTHLSGNAGGRGGSSSGWSGSSGSGGRDFVMGVYPMLLDETCFFLAADFDGGDGDDGADWQRDAVAFLETCRRLGIPVALERSRSGNGAHAWFFFEDAVPAALARKLGSFLLTETMERRPELGFASYDRLFPSQDTLPKGGFGNLIALPLQRRARAQGNSLFVDAAGAVCVAANAASDTKPDAAPSAESGVELQSQPQLQPYPDQWAFLSSVEKISRARLEAIVSDAERRGRVMGVRLAFDGEDADADAKSSWARAPWAAPASRCRAEPPIAGTLPEKLELVLGDQIYIANENGQSVKEALPAPLRNRLLRLAAFQNPEFYRAQAMRLSTYGKPRVIHCAEELPGHIALPRGCLDEVRQLLESLGIEAAIRDERHAGTPLAPLAISFQGTLRPEQQVAAREMLKHDTGVLAATTAFGKTVLAAWLIAQRGAGTLVLVHRQQLLEQWVERLSAFLGIPAKKIGRLGGGHKKLTGCVDVALIQSLVRKGVVIDNVGTYGHLIVDECHHLPAWSFEQVARRAKARYVTGLSATVTRKDGHHPIIFMQCGPVRHRVDARTQAAAQPYARTVLVRPTGFRFLQPSQTPQTPQPPQPSRSLPPSQLSQPPEDDPRKQYQALVQALQADEARNAMIRADVLQAVREGRKPLILTERTGHLELLSRQLATDMAAGSPCHAISRETHPCRATLAGETPLPRDPHGRDAHADAHAAQTAEGGHVVTLQGGMGKKALRAALDALARIPENAPRVIIATGAFAGEGFDDSALDTLFLTLPVSWRGTVAQYAGRLHRLHEGKREVRIYDYADLDEPMLARMFDKRCRGYESLGYSIMLPASAISGWPADVPLPVDPEWKRDYAATVRRLIRDGVDTPLASLFVHAARAISESGASAERELAAAASGGGLRQVSTDGGLEERDRGRARSASEAFLFRRLETLSGTAGLFQLNATLPVPFD